MAAGPKRPADSAAQSFMDQLIAAYAGDTHAVMETLKSHIPPRMFARDRPVDAHHAGRGRGRPSYELREPPTTPVIFRVRVDIDGAKPPIWRRLELAGDLTLTQVHRAIQLTFGWQEAHLHQFIPHVDGLRDMTAPSFANPGLDDAAMELLAPEDQVRLDQVVAATGDRLFYEYDFGDGWVHTLTVERLRPREAEPSTACVGGRRAGPPEDCGGIWRYNDIVAALTGDDQGLIDAEDLADAREWLGGEFDPAEADLEGLEDLDSVVLGGRSDSWAQGGQLTPPEVVVTAPRPDGIASRGPLREAGTTTVSVLRNNPRLAASLAELVELADDAQCLDVVGTLVARTGMHLTGLPIGAARAALFASLSQAEAEAVTEPWRSLVATVAGGEAQLVDGVLRTAPQPGDEALFDPALVSAPARGASANVDVVHAAVRLGLLRRAHGRIVVTRAGRVAAGDPIRLWRHLADRLTRGVRTPERILSALALLVIAGEGPSQKEFRRLGTTLVPRLGFVGADWLSPTPAAVLDATRTVWVVFAASGGLDSRHYPTDAGRRLARASLLA